MARDATRRIVTRAIRSGASSASWQSIGGADETRPLYARIGAHMGPKSKERREGSVATCPAESHRTQTKVWRLGWAQNDAELAKKTQNPVADPAFMNYNLPDAWYVTTAPMITANWEANSDNRWTVPLGAGVGKSVRIGTLPVNVQPSGYYDVVRPDDAAPVPEVTTGWTRSGSCARRRDNRRVNRGRVAAKRPETDEPQ